MSYKNVSVTEAFQKLEKNKNAVLVDVRESDEYSTLHAAPAISIPLSTVNEKVKEKLKDYNEIYVICRSGGRSMMGTEIFNSLGLNAINVEGGTIAWRAKSLPII